jgi:hypothetical protein
MLEKIKELLKSPRFWIAFVAVLLALIATVVFGFVMGRWIWVVVTLLVLLLGLLIFLVWKFYNREREDRAGRGTQENEDATVVRRREELQSSQTLEEGFGKALAVIQARQLEGLPWYLVLGPAGAGKTALLRASGLELPSAVESLVEFGPTSSCSWWLTNQAVMVDTAGRLSATHEGNDHKEWKHLLALIRKHRKRPAVNGVIVALSAAELLEASKAQLEEQASELRRHLNELVDGLGVDPPIYLILTQGDRVQGLSEAALALGSKRIGEALGWTNKNRHPHEVKKTVRDAFERMRGRFEGALPELLVREHDPARRRRLFLLPQELEALGSSTAQFVARAFQPTRYDEVPFLRGIYVTSARHDGAIVSPLLSRLGHAWAATPSSVEGPAEGWFLRDIFRKLLLDPEEQSLAVPTDRVGPRTRAILLSFAGVGAVVLLGLWATAFVKNWSAIGEIRVAAEHVVNERYTIAALDGLRETIESAEARSEDTLHRVGLGGPFQRAIERGSLGFASVFGQRFERPAKTEMLASVRGSDADAFAALLDLIADVSFLASRGGELRLRPSLELYGESGRSKTERRAFADGYSAFARWAPTLELQSRVDEEQQRFDDEAPRLLDIVRLEAWCAEHEEIAQPILASKLGLPQQAAPALSVPGCYTRAFYEEWLGRVFASLRRSGSRSEDSVVRFREDYGRRYADAWQNFLVTAPRPAVANPQVRNSPYLKLMGLTSYNTQVSGLWQGEAPGWVYTLYDVLRKTPTGEQTEEDLPRIRYIAALDSVGAEVERARGRGHVALKIARDVGDGQESPFIKAVELVREIVPITPDEENRTAKNAIRSLLMMPILNGFSSVLEAASREIDLAWRDQVVAPFPPPLTPESHARLYGPGGALERFKKETLGGFWAGTGPRPLLEDRAMPLTDHFAAFVSSGGAGKGGGGGALPSGPQTVRMIGAPSSVSGGAGVFVIGRRLILACATRSEQVFEYTDGAGEKAMVWSPDCDFVQLVATTRSADGDERELSREWSGSFAFAQFLRSGKAQGDGSYAWRLRDPHGSGLAVDLRYKRRGGDAILRFEKAASRTLPSSATASK